jgi:hypothetical protein
VVIDACLLYRFFKNPDAHAIRPVAA